MRLLVKLLSVAGIIAGITIAAVVRASDGIDGELTALRADDLVVVQAGEVIYAKHCAACHGAQLEGEPDWRIRDANGMLPAPPHDASGHTWHHADDQLFEITKYGMAAVIADESYLSKMPAYENILSDEQIIAVLSYIKNSWPQEEREWQDKVNGTQINGFKPIEPKKSTILDKLFK